MCDGSPIPRSSRLNYMFFRLDGRVAFISAQFKLVWVADCRKSGSVAFNLTPLASRATINEYEVIHAGLLFRPACRGCPLYAPSVDVHSGDRGVAVFWGTRLAQTAMDPVRAAGGV